MFPRSFLRWVCFTLGLWCAHSVQAGRNDGINVSYECLGDNDYRITVNLYRDCAEFTDTPDFIPVHISSGCATLGYVNLEFQYGQEVSQLCPDALPNSSCNGGSLPGVDLSVFEGVVELEPCTDWKFIVAEQNRAIVTNLDDPGMDSRIHIETLLNNSDGSCNSSPAPGLLNLPFICTDFPFFYNLDFQDTDGDSLVYALVPAITSGMDGVPHPMNYHAGYSGAAPMESISIDPHTGQINILPALSGKFTVVVRVREYRNGVKVGEVFHDFNVFVNACDTPPPGPEAGTLAHVSGGGYPLSEDEIGICPGDDFCFEIAFASENPSVSLTLSSNLAGIIPGVVETVVGTNPAIIQFCGTAPLDIDNQTFLITALDDVCEISGQAYYAISFLEREPIDAGPDTTVCAGTPLQLAAYNDTLYTWYDADGTLLQVPEDISCNPCRQPTVAPDSTTTYVLVGAYGESNCSSVDSVVVTVPLALEVNAMPETCYRNDGIIDVQVLSGSGNYSFHWDDIGPGPPSRNGLSGGTYAVTVEDLDYGCTKSRSINLDHLPLPETDAGSESFSCGLTLQLEAVPSFGSRLWSSPDGVVFDDPGAFDAQATAPAEGDFTLVWTEDDGDGCVDSDTLTVTFFLAPQAGINAPDSICGLETIFTGNAVNGDYFWHPSPGLTLDNGGLTPGAAATGFGDEVLVLEVINGLCTATDTATMHFIPMPDADAGSEVNVCGSSVTLQPNPSVGAGEWLLPPVLIPGMAGPNGQLEITASQFGAFDLVWTETAEGFCTSRDTVAVRFTEQPILNLPTDTVACADSLFFHPGEVAGITEWQVDEGYFANILPEGGAYISGPPGNTQIVVSADNGYGCTETHTIHLTLFAPVHTEILVPDTVCGLSTVVSATGEAMTFGWSSASGGFDDPAAANTVFSVPAPGDYVLNVSTEFPGGCMGTASAVVTFVENPEPFAGEDVAICGLVLEAQGSASAGEFLWYLETGLNAANPASPTSPIYADQYGTYALVAQESNLGCSQTDTAWVEFRAPPEIIEPQWHCTPSDGAFVLEFEASGGNPANWSVGGVEGTFSSSHFVSIPLPSETPVTAWLSNGDVCPPDTVSGTLWCEVITSAGSLGSDTLRVCGQDTAFATVTAPPTLDGNDSLRYVLHDGSSTTLGNILAWNVLPEFTAPGESPFDQVFYISAVAGNFGSAGIDLGHEQVSISEGQPVIFYPLPEAFVDFEYSICPGDTLEIDVSMNGGFPQTFTYSMAGVTHTVHYGMSLVYILVSDSGTFVPVSTSSQYCEGVVWGSGQVNFHEIPQMEANMVDFVCGDEAAALELTTNTEGTVAFTLDWNGAAYGNYLVSGDTALALSEAGTYTIYEIENEHCVSDTSIVFHLDVHDVPEVQAGPDRILCTGDTTVIGMSAVPGVNYAWSGSNGIQSPGTSQTAFFAANTGYYPQTHHLVLTAETEFCAAFDTVRVEVYPRPQLQLLAPEAACFGENITLMGYGATSYEWTPHGLFDDPFAAYPSLTAIHSGDYALTGSNIAGCSDTLYGHLTVHPRPSSGFSISSESGCVPLDVTIQVDDPFPGAVYHWNTGEGSREGTEVLIFETYAEPGTRVISMEAVSPQGCVSEPSEPKVLEVFGVEASFGYAPLHPSVTNSTVFFTNSSSGSDQWRWTVDSVLYSTERNFRLDFPREEGKVYTVCLDVVGGPGCMDRACRTVSIAGEPLVYVPNAFTPDGDGLNDLFYPEMTFVDGSNYRFWILDRNGQTVFETTDLDGKWNGSQGNSGYFAPPGVYVWHLVVDIPEGTERKHFSGRVTLIR